MTAQLKIVRAAVVAPMAAAAVSLLVILLLAEYSQQPSDGEGAGLVFFVAVGLSVVIYPIVAVLSYVVPTFLIQRGIWSIRLSMILTLAGVIAQSLVLTIPYLPHQGALSAFRDILIWTALSGSTFCIVWWWVATSSLTFKWTVLPPMN